MFGGILFKLGTLPGPGWKRRRAGLAGLAIMLVLAGCSASKGAARLTGPLPDRSATDENTQRLQALIAARAATDEEADYVIAPGDLLTLTIYNFRPGGGDFITDLRVDERGYISSPMTGPVQAEGLTVADLEQALVDALKRNDVMRQPMLKVFLKDYVGQRVVVLGAVVAPKMYHLSRGRQTLIDVISMAGGLKNNAGNYVLLHPAANTVDSGPLPLAQQYALNTEGLEGSIPDPTGNSVLVPINIDEGMAGSGLVELFVEGGDLIIVPPAGQAFLEGEVAKAGLYPLTHGMTLTQLIATAGGLTFPAAKKRIKLVRRTSGPETSQWVIDVNRIESQQQPDILLEPQDRIVVPATPGRWTIYSVYRLAQAVIRIGVGGTVALF
jgi:polysaccharide export outer membrane protein